MWNCFAKQKVKFYNRTHLPSFLLVKYKYFQVYCPGMSSIQVNGVVRSNFARNLLHQNKAKTMNIVAKLIACFMEDAHKTT